MYVYVQQDVTVHADVFIVIVMYEVPSKHKTFVQHLYNIGPTSSTLVQLCTNVIQMFCDCRVVTCTVLMLT